MKTIKYKALFPHRTKTNDYIGLCTKPDPNPSADKKCNDVVVKLFTNGVALRVKPTFEHIFIDNSKARAVSLYGDKYTMECEFQNLGEVQDYLFSRGYIICSDNMVQLQQFA